MEARHAVKTFSDADLYLGGIHHRVCRGLTTLADVSPNRWQPTLPHRHHFPQQRSWETSRMIIHAYLNGPRGHCVSEWLLLCSVSLSLCASVVSPRYCRGSQAPGRAFRGKWGVQFLANLHQNVLLHLHGMFCNMAWWMAWWWCDACLFFFFLMNSGFWFAIQQKTIESKTNRVRKKGTNLNAECCLITFAAIKTPSKSKSR